MCQPSFNSASATANITSGIKVEDDGPVLDINPSGATIALNLDESIVLPTTTTDESGVIAAGSDDIAGVTTVDHINPFGRTSTAAGAVAGAVAVARNWALSIRRHPRLSLPRLATRQAGHCASTTCC